MKLAFFKTLWGHTGSYQKPAEEAAAVGFTGVEGPFPTSSESAKDFLDALATHRLSYIAEISTTGFAVPDPGSTVQEHLDAMERIIEQSLPAKPLFFSAMAGSDLWQFADSVKFLSKAREKAKTYHVRVGFETHRSRSLFHPIVTANLLAEVPDIELTLDFSHWCNVCERLVLDELPDVLALCARRAIHIQPRVGYDQGAQVPCPSHPRYASAVDAHLRWWKIVLESMQLRGFETATLTPEFGPDGYQQIDAATDSPVGDLWEMNRWIADRITGIMA
ncbi:MAG: hypothetical protein Fur0032_24270 [Terrimicrobiaceae bacterium]